MRLCTHPHPYTPAADDADAFSASAAARSTAAWVLLCHRSAQRRWYPDVWDLPGGHLEPDEFPAAALARELREELGISIAAPTAPPMWEIHADTFDMQIWLIGAWTGSPTDVARGEHDVIAWFEKNELADLRLAHDSYLETFTAALA